MAATLLATLFLLWELIGLYPESLRNGAAFDLIEQSVFIFLALILIYGGVVYQLARIGYFKRLQTYQPIPQERIDAYFVESQAPTVTVLVPSYKEEIRTIEQTLLSAALQTYPNRRVVLLIDDPPDPDRADDLEKLEAARKVPDSVRTFMEPLLISAEHEKQEFETRETLGDLDLESETRHLVSLYESAATHFERKAAEYPNTDHNDGFFIEQILLGTARDYLSHAESLRSECPVGESRLHQEYERFVGLFQVEVTFFERKQYLNLSHEPNKAMNLNSYIGLTGQSFNVIPHLEEPQLRRADTGEGSPDLWVPEAKYVVTLDADSVLTSGYVQQLVYHMEQPENERVAVAQTPYTAIPGASGLLERFAGATTDIQYLMHQGSAFFSAAYWVGANAVLRTAALEEVSQEFSERGFKMRRFIQDRTVIEDTESTLDLIESGWEIYNHPGRLAYSATPPDYGSILIQRRRWANGGLVILPKLLRYLSRPYSWRKVPEGFIRVHYLASLAGVNTALLLLFVYPFEDDLSNYWLPLAAVPYFYLYARDLSMIGRRFWEVVGVYAFNLMLIPIQLGGVVKSLQQALTGVKSPFGRTPKVSGRTAAPRLYICAPFVLLIFFLSSIVIDAMLANYLHLAISAINAVVFFFVVTKFVGIKASLEDLRLPGLKNQKSIKARS